ncbi:MAG TPA: hypothetical protein VIF60_05840 [Burkholderiaceae bacterium]|jgi:hypothetical protein
MPSASALHQLLELGKRFHIADPKEAFGRCFAATLEFAACADGHGYETQLIRWQVAHDPDFCDHWAILFHESTVLDLTRVQVDGNPDLVHKLDTYPANYHHPRRYPSAILLQNFQRLTESRLGRLPFWFMWDCGVAMVCYDIRSAIKARHFGEFVQSLVGAARFAWRSTWIGLHYHLVREPQSSLDPNTIQ